MYRTGYGNKTSKSKCTALPGSVDTRLVAEPGRHEAQVNGAVPEPVLQGPGAFPEPVLQGPAEGGLALERVEVSSTLSVPTAGVARR